jgi:hypothetical protein
VNTQMGMFTVIPSNTFDGLQVDAGVLLKTFNPLAPAAPADADIICATTGGIQVSCTPTYSDFGADIDNVMNNSKELKHLDSWECTASTTAVSLSPRLVKLGLGAADISTVDATKIVPRRDLSQDDFRDIWWVGDKIDGGWVAVKIKNALSTGGFAIQTSKNGKGQFSLTITGHVSLNAQSEVPMEFYVVDASEGAEETPGETPGTNTGTNTETSTETDTGTP